VAIIGAGPAGLAAAHFVINRGYEVTVFEANREIGGMLRREVAQQRLPEAVLDAQLAHMKEMGVVFRTGTRLGRDLLLNDLRDERYRAIFLATGFQSNDHAPLSDEITMNEKKRIAVDPVTLETDAVGIFAGGGAILHQAPLVKVIASAKRAALSMHRYLQARDLRADREQAVRRVENLPKKGIKPKPRQEDRAQLTEEGAIEEASRCMTCGGRAYIAHPEDCMTCYECEVQCPANAVDVHPFKEPVTLTLPLS
jgi:NADPH-dependent glutamate synthase beta subunit-like oxidoreductase/NAD-dependent dihydropyrimidine dehydrogenase PreA subunit